MRSPASGPVAPRVRCSDESGGLPKNFHDRISIDTFRSIFIRYQLRLQENILVWIFDLVQRLFLFVSQIPCIANYVVSFTRSNGEVSSRDIVALADTPD